MGRFCTRGTGWKSAGWRMLPGGAGGPSTTLRAGGAPALQEAGGFETRPYEGREDCRMSQPASTSSRVMHSGGEIRKMLPWMPMGTIIRRPLRAH